MRPFQRSKTESHAASPVLSKPNTPMYGNDPTVRNSKFRKPRRLDLTLWKIKYFGWSLQASRPKLTLNNHFWGSLTDTPTE